MASIREIADPQERMRIAREILEDLTDWFEVTEAREGYITESAHLTFLAAYEGGSAVGFLCLRPTGRDTAEIRVTGVKKRFRRGGIGAALIREAIRTARRASYSFLQVKTVKTGCYPEYDATNRFYLAVGFREFEVFPDLWDRANPCQIYVMALQPSVRT